MPVVTKGPVPYLEVCVGGTINLECNARAHPQLGPFINWRLNWGCICSDKRCEMKNDNGSGKLIIKNAKLSDSGAYSCEVMNSIGRVIHTPDAIVKVIGKINI